MSFDHQGIWVDDNLARDFFNRFKSEDTDELVSIISAGVTQKHPREAFVAIHRILLDRDEPVRLPDVTLDDEKRSTEAFQQLHPESNAEVRRIDTDLIEVRFSKDGTVVPVRNQFRDQAELRSFVADLFSLDSLEQDTPLAIPRTGKYQRVNRRGAPIFTFGNLLLDLITDEEGVLVIGDDRIDARLIELSEPSSRGRGITSIDLSPYVGNAIRNVLTESVTGAEHTVVQARAEWVELARASSLPETCPFGNPATGQFGIVETFAKDFGFIEIVNTTITTFGIPFLKASILTFARRMIPISTEVLCFGPASWHAKSTSFPSFFHSLPIVWFKSQTNVLNHGSISLCSINFQGNGVGCVVAQQWCN